MKMHFLLCRMYVDDNLNSAVLVSARAIECTLIFDITEKLFKIMEVRLWI